MSFRKGMYYINGVERMVLADPEKETVADVLRRLGLTGVKIGCGIGQCGACTVLINDKPVRACVKKWKTIEEHTRIETIEGIGVADNLHPLQLAWIKYGGVQCGYCTPGFIMSAKGLLKANPSPTREEVREWFTKNNNLCRCTGYKPLVDAVMAAAEVMRGEKPKESLIVEYEEGKLYNSYAPRPTVKAKVMGCCDYAKDMNDKLPEGSLQLAVVWSKHYHARIKGIDFAEAEKMPGVEKVITHKDIKGTNSIGWEVGGSRSEFSVPMFPILAVDKVNRIGDPIALVAADTEEHARQAAEKVVVTYEELPFYRSVVEASAPGAVQVIDGIPNVHTNQPLFKGEDVRPIFAEAEKEDSDIDYVSGAFSSSREPHLPIEPSYAHAYMDEDDVLTLGFKVQDLHFQLDLLPDALGVPADKVRLAMTPAGGSFGYTMTPDVTGMVGAACLATGKPVALNMTYAETQRQSGKRSACFTNGRLAFNKKTGKLLAMDLHNLVDSGGQIWQGPDIAMRMTSFAGAPYNIPNLRALIQAGSSNQAYGTAYRGWGSPQQYTPSEALIDMAARKCGMDPFEFRYINAIEEGDSMPNQIPYNVYVIKDLLDMLRPKYEEALKWKSEQPNDGWKRGVGLGIGGFHVSEGADYCEVALELNPDGSVTSYNAWEEMGQGADIGSLTETYEALRPLGLTIDQIHLYQNDTRNCPATGPAAGSRSHFMAGLATIDAANQLMDAMRKDDGTYRTYDEMIAENIPVRYTGVKDNAEDHLTYASPNDGSGCGHRLVPDQNHVAYVVCVEVEEATGKVKVVRCESAADVGVVGNYLAVKGQAEGGFEHCVGFALSEDYYDDVKKCATPLGSGFPKCNEVPDDMNFEFLETPRVNGPWGSGGCSEGFQSVGHVPILNAIDDAVGVRITQIPATPDKVKAALDAKARGEDYMPEMYDFHCDPDEILDYIKANPVDELEVP